MSVFGPDYATFVIGRFLMGAGGVGYVLTGYVIGNDKNCIFNVCSDDDAADDDNHHHHLLSWLPSSAFVLPA